MSSTKADVVLLTEQRYTASFAPQGDWYLDNILRDDQLLQSALARHGLSSVRLDWASSDVDWSQFRCAVFRTTWDYFERRHEFTDWLNRIRRQTRLCNDAALIDWNMEKHYLADLEAKGIPIVPSNFIERGSTVTLLELLDESGWDEAILKPCISGAARHTYRVNRESAAPLEPVLRQLLTDESLILQPLQKSVLSDGEDALMFFNGCVTHAVRKVPKPGDFRVQDDYGGTVHPHEPSTAQIDLTQRVLAACPIAPTYGRLDLVRDNHGNLAVMELELIEPELWLRNHPPAATAFADAIAKIVLD
ncbi:MAG: RimK family alpha-L-glutamate ligase [Planctomycetaceae bacterium]